MTREERLELLKQIEKNIHVCSLESTLLDDAMSCAIHSAIEELEQEHCNKQRYVVKGINNDKIEFVDKYSVRAFNRYVKFIKNVAQTERKVLEQETVIDKIRAEIITRDRNVKTVRGDSCCFFTAEEVLEILDKYQTESEDE